MPETTRFAPSPTGWLHLGHAYAAMFAAEQADRGRFLIRLEDIDATRARHEYEEAIFEDLAWLGLSWEKLVRRQSDHFEDYRAALGQLEAKDLLYPVFARDAKSRTKSRELETHRKAPMGRFIPAPAVISMRMNVKNDSPVVTPMPCDSM